MKQTLYKQKDIQVYNDVDENLFKEHIYPLGVPAVLRGVDIGPCAHTWNFSHIMSQLSTTSRKVAVHVSDSPRLNFLHRNFQYRTLPLTELLHRISGGSGEDYFLQQGEYYYLRSLGDNPRKEVSNFHQQFPEIAEDLVLPPFFPPDSFFSSVLRASSPGLTLWTHYDVMDNLLIQVIGSKEAILFSPTDADNLYLKGDKSEITDLSAPDNAEHYPRLAAATAWVATLQPGDILFIPALWLHTMTALDPGLAINVFWKSLPKELYAKNDLYGNCDPMPATQAMEHIKKAVKLLNTLPEPYLSFYTHRASSLLTDTTDT